jgi:hypothetical protein
MNTFTKSKKSLLTMMSGLIIAHAILWGSAIIASAITLKGDTHAGAVTLSLALCAGTSMMILFFNAMAMDEKGKSNHDA